MSDAEDNSDFGMSSLEDSLTGGDLARLNFNRDFGNPVSTKHSNIEEVPDEAEITFPRCVRQTSMQFLIKRAMLDPNARVEPL